MKLSLPRKLLRLLLAAWLSSCSKAGNKLRRNCILREMEMSQGKIHSKGNEKASKKGKINSFFFFVCFELLSCILKMKFRFALCRRKRFLTVCQTEEKKRKSRRKVVIKSCSATSKEKKNVPILLFGFMKALHVPALFIITIQFSLCLDQVLVIFYEGFTQTEEKKENPPAGESKK